MKGGNKMHYNVKLTDIEGGWEDYADLMGRTGKLMRMSDGISFMPEGADDLLMIPSRVRDDGKKVVVSTLLGNKFTFRILENDKGTN